jgi:hypothetical protein
MHRKSAMRLSAFGPCPEKRVRLGRLLTSHLRFLLDSNRHQIRSGVMREVPHIRGAYLPAP